MVFESNPPSKEKKRLHWQVATKHPEFSLSCVFTLKKFKNLI